MMKGRRDQAIRIIQGLEAEMKRANQSLSGHLRLAKEELWKIAAMEGILAPHITGRIKSRREAINKLLVTPDNSLSGICGHLAGMDRIGIRIVVRTDAELQKLLQALLPNSIFLKDYVKEPRRDGEYLGGLASDVYKGYHLFTKRLTGAPLELQMFTTKMRHDGIKLKRKYGVGYWKSRTYRLRRIEAGDLR